MCNTEEDGSGKGVKESSKSNSLCSGGSLPLV